MNPSQCVLRRWIGNRCLPLCVVLSPSCPGVSWWKGGWLGTASTGALPWPPFKLGLRPCCWLMSGPVHLPAGKGQSVGPVRGMGVTLLAPLVLVSFYGVPTETWGW